MVSVSRSFSKVVANYTEILEILETITAIKVSKLQFLKLQFLKLQPSNIIANSSVNDVKSQCRLWWRVVSGRNFGCHRILCRTRRYTLSWDKNWDVYTKISILSITSIGYQCSCCQRILVGEVASAEIWLLSRWIRKAGAVVLSSRGHKKEIIGEEKWGYERTWA